MRKFLLVILFVLCAFALVNCSTYYRVYQEPELEQIAVNEYGFSELIFFKVIDSETAEELTGTAFSNGGLIYGLRGGEYSMLFIPKKVSQEPIPITGQVVFDVYAIYEQLELLEDSYGNHLYNDPSGDFGALSVSVLPSQSIREANPSLEFDTNIFFIFTTDTFVFNVTSIDGVFYIFDNNGARLS